MYIFAVTEKCTPSYIKLSETFSNEEEATKQKLIDSIVIYKDFISADEENSIFQEIEPYLKRMHYEFDHWDDVIKIMLTPLRSKFCHGGITFVGNTWIQRDRKVTVE